LSASCIALPSGEFSIPIFDVVIKELTIKGSIVGTRQDQIEAFDFAARGLINCTTHPEPFENVSNVIKNLRQGKYEGRAVLIMK
jgi:propanol-preferring alcohol dehydrogenase